MGTKSRDTAIDLIKAFAILGVIAIHVGSRTLTENTIGSFEWLSGLVWGTFFRASVPLFLMTSGAIMLEPAKSLTLKRLYLHNIARIIAAMLVWGFAYKVFNLLLWSQLSVQSVLQSLKQLLLFDHEFHFYYIHIILIVYILLPVTRSFVENADKKLFRYAMAVWAVFAIIFPTVQSFWPFNLLHGTTGRWIISMTYASVGYGLVGYYLKKYPLSVKTALICLLGGVSIIFFATFYMSHRNGALYELFLSGASIGVCAYAVGIFAILSRVPLKGVLKRIVVFISKGSFCIYLSHMFILYTAERFSLNAMSGPAILTIPLISVVTLLICLIIYAVIAKIPVLNKWIV